MSAKVECKSVCSYTVEYVITGSETEVTDAVNTEKRRWPPAGYSTWFNWPHQLNLKGQLIDYMKPKEVSPGVWEVRGYRHTSCD